MFAQSKFELTANGYEPKVFEIENQSIINFI